MKNADFFRTGSKARKIRPRLRATRKTTAARIRHIPAILYHWREVDRSASKRQFPKWRKPRERKDGTFARYRRWIDR